MLMPTVAHTPPATYDEHTVYHDMRGHTRLISFLAQASVPLATRPEGDKMLPPALINEDIAFDEHFENEMLRNASIMPFRSQQI